ncbi:MAG: hypothetical protein L0Z50_06445 [Verrucomicrobiales bacterium]|nr:hypothetical protein [Verrucomicrobiales bacterium]
MPSFSTTNSRISPLLLLLGCLILLLSVFFRSSFSESQILFANDAPLGQLKTQEGKGLDNFFGVWMELNWIGSTQPSALPNLSNFLYLFVGPLGFAKFYAPVALLILGLSAGLFFHQLGFGRVACVLGGMAAMLNTGPFSYACWGLPSLPLCMASIFLALAALVSRPGRMTWGKAALAGLAVGFSITEGFDNGAIFSLYIAAFALCQSWVETEVRSQKLLQGVVRVVVIAVFAAFMAAQAISTLVGTQIQGIVGTQQDAQTKQAHWDLATAGSLPKIEALRVVIPGLFGYRMDTPEGGSYWGSAGQTPGIRESRHSGAGVYAGVLVVLIAVWALARSLVKQSNPFSDRERRFIWFWTGAAVISLLLAFGRHAPFYQFIYALPYFSTIRLPIKFMHPFTICIVTLFAYGLEGLTRSYLARPNAKEMSLGTQIKAWLKNATRFDRNWTIGVIVAIAASLLGWLMYVSSRVELIRYLQSVGFRKELNFPENAADLIARFSFTEAGWFIFFLVLSALAMLLILSGALAGQRAKWAAILLGLILVTDFARANAPWIIYENYHEKYAANSVIEFLRQQPHEHRVAGRLSPLASAFLAQGDFVNLYSLFWMQHLFPYYGVQCLDIIQMPRMPELDATYLRALTPSATNLFPIARLWQLTNTRFQLGMPGPYLEALNQQIDPAHRSFRVATNFDLAPKSSASATTGLRLEDITATLGPKGQFAVFELTNALPRARLFSQWEVSQDDNATLAKLVNPSFDPLQSVLLSDEAPTPLLEAGPADPGIAQITQYAAKKVQVKTQARTPRILLLNDRFHPAWKVLLDGQPVPLLRANFIMRAVHLPPGEHMVEFRFEPSAAMFFVSLAGLLLAFVLWGLLTFGAEQPATVSRPVRPA